MHPQGEEEGGGHEIRSTVILGLGFFFTFTAWHSAQNLQSSLPLHTGVDGETALGIVYSLLPVGYFLAPTLVASQAIRHTSCLWRTAYFQTSSGFIEQVDKLSLTIT